MKKVKIIQFQVIQADDSRQGCTLGLGDDGKLYVSNSNNGWDKYVHQEPKVELPTVIKDPELEKRLEEVISLLKKVGDSWGPIIHGSMGVSTGTRKLREEIKSLLEKADGSNN